MIKPNQSKPWILMDRIIGYKWINGLNELMDLVDWVKMIWIVITKPIKIYNKQKLKSNI